MQGKFSMDWIPPPSLSFLGFLPSRLLREFNILLCRLVHKANRETILVRGLRRQGNMVIHLENVRWGMFCAPLFRFRWFMGDRIFRGKLIFLRDDLGLGVFSPSFLYPSFLSCPSIIFLWILNFHCFFRPTFGQRNLHYTWSWKNYIWTKSKQIINCFYYFLFLLIIPTTISTIKISPLHQFSPIFENPFRDRARRFSQQAPINRAETRI